MAKNKKRGRPVDEDLAQRRKEEILLGATELFARQGYRKTDVQAIADQAGLAKGTIYRYFSTKRDLFLATVDRAMNQLQERVQTAAETIEDSLEKIEVAIVHHMAFFEENPQFVELLIQERAEFKNRQKPTYFQHQEANIGPWLELTKSLVEEGRLRPMEVEKIANCFSDLLYGAIFTNYFANREEGLEDQAQDLIEFGFYGILSDEERIKRGRK